MINRIIFGMALIWTATCFAAEQPRASSSGSSNQGQGRDSAPLPISVVTDPSYKLTVGDQINVSVYEEPDLTCAQLIDSAGIARLNEIGDTKLTGMTVREAEHAIEEIYRTRKILKKPVVTLVVTGFTSREAMVFGRGIGAPGPVAFPPNITSLDIVEVITRAGGFKPGARSSEVVVRRKGADGREVPTIVDVESMINGRKRGDQKRESFVVLPGDYINVEMSLF